jgi:ATP-dependent 26S proteasome regulatory subunit
MPTKSQVEAANITTSIKARNCFIWVVTGEEARVEVHLAEAALEAKFRIRFWDCGSGVTDLQGRALDLEGKVIEPDYQGNVISPTLGADAVLNQIKATATKGPDACVWVLRDFPAWITGPGGVLTLRPLRNLARSLPAADYPQAIIVLSPSAEVPPELQGQTVVVRWPMPDREELADMLDRMASNQKYKIDLNGTRDAAIDAAVGLSGEEAESCFARSLVALRKIDPVRIAQEKKAVIAKAGLLEWMTPLPNGFDSVGGLDVIKTWTLQRRLAYSTAARAYGLPTPKGIFLVGVSGCGKSLIAKAIATVLGGWPLVRWDFGAMKSKYVGDSEQNFRKVQEILATMGRVVVLIDEIEKGLAGAVNGSADGGASADQLGSFLTWMQERQDQVFVIATSNDVTKLPPELLRKGRFDELFWVDLPTNRERVSVLEAALRQAGRGKVDVDCAAVASVTEKFSGAEIAALVPDALFAAFADGERELATSDLIAAARAITPLATTSAETIDKMRAWAKGRTRPATTPDAVAEVAAVSTGRKLDL